MGRRGGGGGAVVVRFENQNGNNVKLTRLNTSRLGELPIPHLEGDATHGERTCG